MREHPRSVFKEKQSGPKLLHGNSDCGSAVTDPCCAEIPGMGQGPVKAKVRRKSAWQKESDSEHDMLFGCRKHCLYARWPQHRGDELIPGHHNSEMVVVRREDVSLTLKESKNDDKHYLNRIDFIKLAYFLSKCLVRWPNLPYCIFILWNMISDAIYYWYYSEPSNDGRRKHDWWNITKDDHNSSRRKWRKLLTKITKLTNGILTFEITKTTKRTLNWRK